MPTLDDFGRTVFRSRPGSEHLYPAEVAGRAILGGGAVRASIVPAMADELIIGGLPADRTPILLLVFLLAPALAAAGAAAEETTGQAPATPGDDRG